MGIAKELLQTDLDYSKWATLRLLDACSPLTDEELRRDLGLSHHSVLETLHHYFLGERFWAGCLLAHAMPPMDEIGPDASEPKAEFDKLGREWPQVWDRLANWFSSIPEEELDKPIVCKLTNRDFDFARWHLLRHCVNHSTLHRGQVVGMLRMLGKRPPNVDLMSYFLRDG